MIRKLTFSLAILTAAIACCWQGAGVLSAQRRGQTAESHLLRVQADASAIRRLRQDLASSVQPVSEAMLAEEVARMLASGGLPASTLASLSVQEETVRTSATDASFLRRRGIVILSPITLPQLGGCLERFEAAGTPWTITTLEVTPVPGNVQPLGQDLALRVTLTLEALQSTRTSARSAP